MKNRRQEKILEIISSGKVETQEDLQAKLREAGFDVTQATVSRDIRELKLIKTSSPSGGYCYSPSSSESEGNSGVSAKYRSVLRNAVTAVDWAGNVVVIKTYSGMAQAAAAAVDHMGRREVVGCVAGDDAIMVLVRTPALAESFANNFRSWID